MSDLSDEDLEDLHKSLLSLCGADETVIFRKRDSDVTKKDQDTTSKLQNKETDGRPSPITSENKDTASKLDNKDEDGRASPSKSSVTSLSETSIRLSDFDTVDETSCSDNDCYTTTSEDASGWSPPKSQRKDEIDGDFKQNKQFLSSDGKSLNFSPIKGAGNQNMGLSSLPNTPGFLPGSKFSFAQSTPMQPVGTKNENGSKKGATTKKSIFDGEDTELSDISFDDLLDETMAMCGRKDDKWKEFLKKSKEKQDKKKDDEPGTSRQGGLKDWKMLYADPNITESKNKTVKIGHSELVTWNESQADDTVIEKNNQDAHDETVDQMFNLQPKEENKGESSIESGQIVSPSVHKPDIPKSPAISKQGDQNLSRIHIDSIFKESEKEAKEKANKDSNGRFTNFTSFILSDIEVTEDEAENGETDLLGLNNFTYSEADDIDIDDDDEATLLDETITNLPESIRNKYKIQEEVTLIKEGPKVTTDVNKNLFKEQIESISSDEKKKEALQSTIEEGELRDTTIKSKDIEEKEDEADVNKVTGKIDYEAERKYFNIKCPEVRDIINQWGSKGIQDPDTNLSSATNFRRKSKDKTGMLEGPHLTCLWIEESIDAVKECSSPMKKRQKLDSEAHNREDVMKLEHELNEMNERYQSCLQELWADWVYERDTLIANHKALAVKLKFNQDAEMREIYDRYRNINANLFHVNTMRLHFEYDQQKQTCRARFQEELNKLKHVFQRREQDVDRNFNHRKNQISSLIEQMKHVKSDGKYGHHVTTQFVKGPCRSNRQTRSLVEVYVPAKVASCILREDEVVDSFYKYV